MNKSDAKHYLPLVQALAEGKTIQIRDGGEWSDMVTTDFTLPPHVYRIKPEPREVWIGEINGQLGGAAWDTREEAQYTQGSIITPIKFREVMDDE